MAYKDYIRTSPAMLATPCECTPCSCDEKAPTKYVGGISGKPTVPEAYSFVHIVEEGLSELNLAIQSLERFQEHLIPADCNSKEGLVDLKQPQITFEYVWGSLPERLHMASHRLDAIHEMIYGVVYKNSKGNQCEAKSDDSDHVRKVEKAMSALAGSVERLSDLPDTLRGMCRPSACESANPKEITFSIVWRDMPNFLKETVERLRKLECELSAMTLGVDGAQEKR
jgi:hypothetical protein